MSRRQAPPPTADRWLLTRSGGATTIRTRSELQARGSAAGRLEFFPLPRPSSTVLPRPTTCIAGAQPTVNNKPTYLSKDGLEKLRAELDEMVSVKRPEVANRIHDAKEHGDLSENAEYEDAKNEQAFVEGRIQTLEALIKNATIIDENHSTDHVQIGSTVAVESPDGKEALHDRRFRRGQARRGPDLEREPGRPRPARQEEGREGRRQGPGRRLHLQDRRHHLGSAEVAWTGRTNSRPGSAARRSSTIRRHRRGRSTSGACAARSSST